MSKQARTSKPGARLWCQAGVTLAELMIAVAVLSIGVLGLVATLGGIQRGIQMAKDKTFASNLAQEKIQIIKQKTYYSVLPTQTPSYWPADNTPYDTVYFPLETILQGGITFTRMTYIQVVTENGSNLSILPNTTPDTGMRQITVTVEWTERGQNKSLAVKSVLSNPNTVETNSIFNGTVKDAAPPNNPISGALASVAENPHWVNTTNNSGAYSINLMPGSYTLVVSAQGYFTQFVYQSVSPNNSTTTNFLLTKMSSGTVTGTPWINPNLVISQVVGTTTTVTGCCGQKDVEYVELFNPTTYQINIAKNTGSGSVGTENFRINTQVGSASFSDIMSCGGTQCVYVSSYVKAGGYFLIASFPSLVVNGQWVTADAYYNTSVTAPNDIPNHICGSVQLTDSNNKVVDQVCWDGASCSGVTLNCNGTKIPTDPNCGLNTGLSSPGCQSAPWLGNQLVRYSSPTVLGRGTFGSAYNSQTNSLDFAYPISGSGSTQGLNYNPFVSTSPALTVISGVPAIGAVVTATDGLSASTMAYSVGSPPVAWFSLPNVATGTWTVLITSSSYQLMNATVTIAATGSIYNFPSSTTILNTAATYGFISGKVTDVSGNPIAMPSAIVVSPGGAGSNTTANTSTGLYLLRVSSRGAVNVTANPNFQNANYISVSSNGVSVNLGQVSSGVNFMLSQGGRLSGWVTADGINPLPGITVAAVDANGYARDTEISDLSGNFVTVNIATGAYTVKPSIDSLSLSSPVSTPATVLLGQTVSVGTFTISGALGSITGTVKSGGKSISTGVLIVATTANLAGTPPQPPTLSTATTTPLIYTTSSREDGSYILNVRQSTSPAYYVYGYYYTVNNGVVSTQWAQLSNVSVTAGQTVANQNFSW